MQPDQSRLLGVLYRLGMFSAFLSGLFQMPLAKRYYLTSLPGLEWVGDFYILSDIHYLAAMMLVGLMAYRLVMNRRFSHWSWGPASWFGWLLWGLLLATGIIKGIKNMGIFVGPDAMMLVTICHMLSAMVLAFSAPFGRRKASRAAQPVLY